MLQMPFKVTETNLAYIQTENVQKARFFQESSSVNGLHFLKPNERQKNEQPNLNPIAQKRQTKAQPNKKTADSAMKRLLKIKAYEMFFHVVSGSCETVDCSVHASHRE